jgi:putative aldouronate transport system permease protein
MERSLRSKLFDIFNYTLMAILGMLTLFPFLQVISQSFSSESALISNKVTVYPIGFHLQTFKYIISDSLFISAFRNSIIITVTGTVLGLFLTAITAYPLSKPHLKGRKLFLIVFIFAWLFQPGIIPNYLLIKQLGLINNLGSLILPSILLIFNMLLM